MQTVILTDLSFVFQLEDGVWEAGTRKDRDAEALCYGEFQPDMYPPPTHTH